MSGDEKPSITEKKWFNMTTADNYVEQLTFEMGKEYEILIKGIEVVAANFGEGRNSLVAKFSVEYEGKVYSLFPHTDLKRKLWKLQQQQKSKSLTGLRVKVKLLRKQGRAFIYSLSLVK